MKKLLDLEIVFLNTVNFFYSPRIKNSTSNNYFKVLNLTLSQRQMGSVSVFNNSMNSSSKIMKKLPVLELFFINTINFLYSPRIENSTSNN